MQQPITISHKVLSRAYAVVFTPAFHVINYLWCDLPLGLLHDIHFYSDHISQNILSMRPNSLRNDLWCVEWDIKPYYTIPYHTCMRPHNVAVIKSIILLLFSQVSQHYF